MPVPDCGTTNAVLAPCTFANIGPSPAKLSAPCQPILGNEHAGPPSGPAIGVSPIAGVVATGCATGGGGGGGGEGGDRWGAAEPHPAAMPTQRSDALIARS